MLLIAVEPFLRMPTNNMLIRSCKGKHFLTLERVHLDPRSKGNFQICLQAISGGIAATSLRLVTFMLPVCALLQTAVADGEAQRFSFGAGLLYRSRVGKLG